MAWVTPEELRLHLRLDTIDQAVAAEVIEGAETVIRGELGQTIDPVSGDVAVLVGTGSTVLLLPEMPTSAVTTVTVDGGQPLTEGTDYRWNRYGILTRLAADSCPSGVWETDTNVAVTYDHGYEVLPAFIKQVCKQLAGRSWASPRLVAAESIGDYSVTYAKDSTGTPVSGQAVTEHERRMLTPFSRGERSR
ncbi:hypothetical protein [Streptomyces meridianus]|uniref:Head-to-tail adaptor n=1 Tax=Streptomyces meridianus TaxID=2938945 RepID=A0ABT0XD48_9ACTN|nr:hypothetical protein [Streptomyces meridianus]MCM2580449.1 hypothetical protein [Streptomyces meridianus]